MRNRLNLASRRLSTRVVLAFLAIALTGAACDAQSAPRGGAPPALIAPTLLPCRHSDAACLWMPDGSEKEIVLRGSRQMPDEWIQNERGDGVALIKGHQDPGVLLGFRFDGQIDGVVDLENGATLSQVAGLAQTGDRILCTFTSLDISCSVLLPSGLTGSHHAIGMLPSGCGFPRTVGSEQICVEEGPDGYEVRRGSLAGTLISRTHINLRGTLSDLQPIGEHSLAILSSDQNLFLVPPSGKLAEIKSDTVLWIAPFGKALAFASCLMDADKVLRCRVTQIDEEQRSQELWRSDTLVPVSGHRIGASLVIDTASPTLTRREVVVFDSRDLGKAVTLWVSH